MSKENQRTYWKSLNQLAQNEEFRKAAEREFPENASELTDGLSRRNFVQIMGASVALAGLASCRKPVQRILPYTRQPEHIVAGKPLYYATSMPFKDYVTGLVVETHSGRPTKIEGNPDHPSSLGSTHVFQQSATLDLYDRDRSRSIRQNGEVRTPEDFEAFCREHFGNTGRRIAFISEASSSPTYQRLKSAAAERFPNSEWVTYEPFSDENRLLGNEMALGSKFRTFYHFDRARTVVSLDEDFMNLGDNNTEYIKRYSAARKVTATNDEMNRLYAVESNYSLTGSNADHRLRIKTSQMTQFVYALAARLSERIGGLESFSGYSNEFSQHAWISVLAEELINSQGESILALGPDHEPVLHSAVAAMNLALGNAGSTVTYHELPHADAGDQNARFAEITTGIRNRDFDTVVLIGTNPVFTAPADLNFSEALEAAPVTIHLSSHMDETSRLSTWHVHSTHFLESWGDGYSYGGARSIIQPMIRPLFDGYSSIEFLNAIITGTLEPGYDLVRETWQNDFITQNFEQQWQQILHDGLQQDTAFADVSVSLSNGFADAMREAIREVVSVDEDAIELVFKPHSRLYDGRFANNGWLQELPDPMTKLTWDSAALMSPATARRIGIPETRRFGNLQTQLVRIRAGQNEVEVPAWVLPGHADNSITVTLGHGRNGFGRVADGVGVNTYPLRTSGNPLYYESVEVNGTGERYPIATTQDHQSMEGRAMVREASLEEYREHPTFAPDMVYVPGRPAGRQHPITLFHEQEYPEHEPQWGMTLDLNACIGCQACTIACQAENNIPVIGKREVHREREMHWLRVDRYFTGDEENPKVVHQPVPCMHCELAPCEQVCPVAATTHSDDGLNQMTYNRCIGTRYCANNCPYKVRRFNFFNYAREFLAEGDEPEFLQMAMNPDVTIRFRGVMEKCTFCVQRLQRAKIDTKNITGDSKKPPDGSVKTACQQACPADAIEFGDLTDDNSIVSQTKRNDRNYLLLEEMNFRPRTSYLAKLRNPNPDIVPEGGESN